MGGGVAGKFTILYPKSIKSLTLIDNMGVYSVKRTKFLENLESGGKNLMLIKTREDLNEMFKLVYHKVPFIPSKIKNVILEEGIKNHDRNKKVFDDLMKEEWYFENELDKINTPTLIMWGEYDEVFDLSSAYLLNKGIKNSKIKIIDNSGHIPMNETPNPTSETVLDFINNIN
jgi:pimeloyl-ACP methyl ester carboxylesterase